MQRFLVFIQQDLKNFYNVFSMTLDLQNKLLYCAEYFDYFLLLYYNKNEFLIKINLASS